MFSGNKFFFDSAYLKNNTQNMVKKLVPDPFIKNHHWTYLWIVWNVTRFVFVCPSQGLPKYIKTKVLTTYFYLLFFKKQKSGSSFFTTFCVWFMCMKYFLCYILLTDQIHCLVVFTSWDIRQYIYIYIYICNIFVVQAVAS